MFTRSRRLVSTLSVRDKRSRRGCGCSLGGVSSPGVTLHCLGTRAKSRLRFPSEKCFRAPRPLEKPIVAPSWLHGGQRERWVEGVRGWFRGETRPKKNSARDLASRWLSSRYPRKKHALADAEEKRFEGSPEGDERIRLSVIHKSKLNELTVVDGSS